MKTIPIVLAGLLVAACNRPGPDPAVCVSLAVPEAAADARRRAVLEDERPGAGVRARAQLAPNRASNAPAPDSPSPIRPHLITVSMAAVGAGRTALKRAESALQPQ